MNDFGSCPDEMALLISPVGLADDKTTDPSSSLSEMPLNYDEETPVSCQRKRKLVYQEEDNSVEPESGDTTFNQIGGSYNGESIADEMPSYDSPLAIIRPGFFIFSYLSTSFRKYCKTKICIFNFLSINYAITPNLSPCLTAK